MLNWIAHWNNWPFVLSLLVGMGLVLMTLFGFSKDLDHGIDTDAPDIAKPESESFALRFAILGVGKVPVSVILEVFLVSFGLIGLLTNAVARDILADWGVLAFPVSLALALVGSVFVTRGTANIISKYAPADAPTSRRIGEFAGTTGFAATLITNIIGQVRVESDGPNEPDALVNACLDSTLETPIERGTEVYIVSYDPDKSLYRVRPLSSL
jgi:hypothetical protein